MRSCVTRANRRIFVPMMRVRRRTNGENSWARSGRAIVTSSPRHFHVEPIAAARPHRKLADIRARMARRILLITRDTQAHKLRATERLETADLSKRDAKSRGRKEKEKPSASERTKDLPIADRLPPRCRPLSRKPRSFLTATMYKCIRWRKVPIPQSQIFIWQHAVTALWHGANAYREAQCPPPLVPPMLLNLKIEL